jgi:3,4-dihydroxy-2-butanone 4-phosphate synthase
MLIVIDDADRENEGDIIIASELTTQKHVTLLPASPGNFMYCDYRERHENWSTVDGENNTALHQTHFQFQ